MSKNRFTSTRQPVACPVCGKRTVSSLNSLGNDCCRDCWDRAGLENEHSDTRGEHYGEAPVAGCPLCREEAT